MENDTRAGSHAPVSSGATLLHDERVWYTAARLVAGLMGGAEAAGEVVTRALDLPAVELTAAAAALPGGDEPTVVVVVVRWTSAALPDAGVVQARFGLTRREAEVALLLAGRLSNKEIQTSLGIGAHTARRHTEQVLRKLRVPCRRHVPAALSPS
jgi:DNA-binding CsgD family transcriptional regulator